MSIAGIKMIPDPQRYGVIAVDAYDGKVPSGRLWYRHFQEEKPFGSLMQLLLLMKDALQELEFPGSYTEIRSFTDLPRIDPVTLTAATNVERELRPGKLGTFRVKIIFQQNASWQGSLSWSEGGKESVFRSVLELLNLMDSALATKTDL